jgi:hypothetical protein
MKAYEFSDAKLGIVFENAEMVRWGSPAVEEMLKLSTRSDGSDVAFAAIQLSIAELFVHGCRLGWSGKTHACGTRIRTLVSSYQFGPSSELTERA